MPINSASPKQKEYLRYLGLAGQWMAMLAAALLLGRWLDGLCQTRFPWFSLLLPLAMLAASLYKLGRDTANPKKPDPSSKQKDP